LCKPVQIFFLQVQNEHGFESDFPAGGTIKKRPSLNPRIPLTNTTWGLVGGSDNDDDNAANVRVGGGGTLLRHSLRRKSSRDHVDISDTQQAVRQHRVFAQVHREPAPPPSPAPAASVDPLSAEFETSLNGVQECENEEYEDEIPLPPPPRAESMDLGALVSPTQAVMLSTPGSEVDDLPPPPPPPEMDENPYHVSPVLHSPPALPPPSLLKPHGSGYHAAQTSRSKKITFDDNVQLIGVSSPQAEDEEEYEPWCPKNIVTEMPKKLPTPPEDFLKDLQRVMTKKWQIAERCRGDETSPHQVLGFRDLDMKNLIGSGHQYSRDNTVGAWVLQSQKYSSGHQKPQQLQLQQLQQHQLKQQMLQQQQHHLQQQQQHHLQQQQQQQQHQSPQRQEPLYAMSTKAHHSPQQQQQHTQRVLSPLPPPAPSQPTTAIYGQPPNSRLPPVPVPQRPPVVLREPTPEYDPYSMNGYQLQQQRVYCPSPVSNHSGSDVSNYSTLLFNSELPYSNGYHSPGPQNFHRGGVANASMQKRAPPPPRRSETTQLTTSHT
jgi:hypothetical protein